MDLDGNGRDELLVHSAGRLCALRPDLTEALVVAESRLDSRGLPAAPGGPRPWCLALRCAWTAHRTAPVFNRSGPIDPECDRRQESPRVLTGPDGTTVCHAATPASAEGTYASPPLGVPARPAMPGDDRAGTPAALGRPGQALRASPRSARPGRHHDQFMHSRGDSLVGHSPTILEHAVAAGATGRGRDSSDGLFGPQLDILDRPQMTLPAWWGILFGVVVVPMVGIPIVAYTTAFVLSLVRVRWLKWLLVLPVVAAILVAGSAALSFLIPDSRQPTGSTWWSIPVNIAMLSMSGLPIVVYAAVLGLALVRRAWPEAARLVARALLAAILIGAITLLFDRLRKPLIEHYDWSGWHQAGYLGAYAAGVLVLLARPARAVGRFLSRLVRRRLPFPPL